ncbi:MAG: hypothetical protein HQK49_21390 [Oligoflexia bacterium]|nr:hypothetical protein [Oligoflexia bacterium]
MIIRLHLLNISILLFILNISFTLATYSISRIAYGSSDENTKLFSCEIYKESDYLYNKCHQQKKLQSLTQINDPTNIKSNSENKDQLSSQVQIPIQNKNKPETQLVTKKMNIQTSIATIKKSCKREIRKYCSHFKKKDSKLIKCLMKINKKRLKHKCLKTVAHSKT